MIPHDAQIAILNIQSKILSTMSRAMALDLAIMPMIVASEPGIGANGFIRSTVGGWAKLMDIRASTCTPEDLMLLKAALKTSNERPVCLLVEDCQSTPTADLAAILSIAENSTATNTLVILHTSLNGVDGALNAIATALRIHRAHVPTAILSMSGELTGKPADQPVNLVGRLTPTGSKIGMRFYELETREPYDHSVRLVVDTSGEDALETTWAIDIHHGDVAIRCHHDEHGQLTADVRDIEILA